MNFWFDLKYAWRLLLKTPGHSVLSIIVVALSVGLAMWSYSLAYAMRFKPLPYPGADRWMSIQIGANAAARPRPSVDPYTYQELLKRNRSANHLGAFAFKTAVLSEGQASTSLRAMAISPRLLSAMRVAPIAGRLFNETESQTGATPVVILSTDTWRTYFASDPAIVGKQARIDGQSMQIIGVLPREFLAFEDSELFIPLQLQQLPRPDSSRPNLHALIRLADGQSPEALLSEMKPAIDDVNASYPDVFNGTRHIALIPGNLTFTHQNLQVVATVTLLAAAVLLLGCVNISMMFLARLLERSRELALRAAVGASRGRLLRQCLLETATVVAIGLLLGYAVAHLGVAWMQSIGDFGSRIEASGRSANQPALRPIDFLAAVATAALIWLLSTLIPAWRVARQDAAVVLAGSGKGVAGRGGARSASVLVALQVIVSSVVLVVCANLVLALKAETRKPTGLNTNGVTISMYPTVFDQRYSAVDRQRYWDELAATIKNKAAGAEVAYATALPSRPITSPASIEGREGGDNQGKLTLPLTSVSDRYFDVLGIQLRAGRLFEATDDSTSLAVAVVDENTARRHWPAQDAVGRRIRINEDEGGSWLTIVGVVSAVTRPYDRNLGVVYRPFRQAQPTRFHVIARLPAASGDARDLLRSAAFAIDRDLPLHNLQPIHDYLKAMNLSSTAMVPAFTAIATITLILAATGLFGLISRSVAQRTQEVGVRRAVGGTQWQVTAVFLRQGAAYLSVGLIGGCLGVLVTRAITASIPNILNRAVPATAGVLVLMAVVIFTASYLPTRRAVALEPGDALRYE
jgi:predicted permease